MKIIKKVVQIGNGAAIYVPKEYRGKELVVLLPEKVDDIKRRVLSKLIEYMPNILGVYLYGSYARGEQEIDSDIDILIVTKDKNDKIKNLIDDIDIRVITLENLKKSIENLPAIIIPILNEAKVFLNPVLIEELKNSHIDFKKFKWNFEDIGRILKITKEFVKLDNENISPSHIYSLIMRIRICYMMESLLKKRPFSNKGIKELLLNYKLKEEEIDKFYSIYRKIKENKDIKIEIKKDEILRLINIVEDYSKKIKNETKKKIKKGN